MPRPIVAIVGRPNVGKSSLFNRLIQKRRAVVDDAPGVTRDRNYADTEWGGQSFTLVDTGGYVLQARDPIEIAVRQQVEQAIEEADLVLLVVDGQTGPADLDLQVGRMLQRRDMKCLLVVNKVDDERSEDEVPRFYSMGLGDPLPVSAISGRYAGDLLDRIVALLPETAIQEGENPGIRIALVGRPNVGKSSFVNRLAGEERAVVDPRAGTTRDATDTVICFHGEPVVLIDTAGLRKNRKEAGASFYAMLRAFQAIERCDVALIVLDAVEGPMDQDKRILSQAMEYGKGAVFVVNKWDLIAEKDTHTMERFTGALRSQVPFASDIPIVFASALTGQRVWRALEIAQQVGKERQKRVPTHTLNIFLEQVNAQHPPPSPGGRAIKLLYVTQPHTAPPGFVFFTNQPGGVPISYQRYLERRLREAFGFQGTPVHIMFRRK